MPTSIADQVKASSVVRLASRASCRRTLERILLAATHGQFHLVESERLLQACDGRVLTYISIRKPADLARCRVAVCEAARAAGFSAEAVRDITLATGEGCANALVHGGGGGHLLLLQDLHTLRVWIEDQGTGIPLAVLPGAALVRGFSTHAHSLGVGFNLMRDLADRVYLSTGSAGTTVVLEFEQPKIV